MSDFATGIIVAVCGVVIATLVFVMPFRRVPRETMRPGPPDAHRAENQVERRRILRGVK